MELSATSGKELLAKLNTNITYFLSYCLFVSLIKCLKGLISSLKSHSMCHNSKVAETATKGSYGAVRAAKNSIEWLKFARNFFGLSNIR